MKKSLFMLAICSLALIPATFPAIPTVFPTGTTIYKPDKAWNGYTIFRAAGGVGPTLIDMNGNVVKQWEGSSHPPKLLPGGYLMRRGAGTSNDFGQEDWDGNIVWKLENSGQHHDFQREGNPVGYYVPGMEPLVDRGKTLILSRKLLKNPKITNELLADDYIYEVTWDGKIVWEWLWNEHLDELGFSEAAKNTMYRHPKYENVQGVKADDWLHINSLSYVGPNKWYDAGDERFHPDNVIWDSREANIMGITDRKTGKIVWKVGPDYTATPALRKLGQIIGQHHAHVIPKGLPGAGNILVFDNGGRAGYGPPNPGAPFGRRNALRWYSRILEFNPLTLELVWEYRAGKVGYRNEKFFSYDASNAQRLPNGNTLITEGAQGRLFEVTPELEIVWEYVLPFFKAEAAVDAGQVHFGADEENRWTSGDADDQSPYDYDWVAQLGEKVEFQNTVYRAYRVPYDWVPQLERPVEEAVIPPVNSKFRIEPPK